MVVNCHVAGTFAPAPDQSYSKVLQLGGIGVELFFVLSGWLLGRQLCLELADTGTIDVWRFWLRRWLRTLPAYFAVLALTYVWQVVLKHNWELCWSYLVFLQGYLTDLPYFGVSWSLCVEEHFYLVIAPIFWLVTRARALKFVLPLLLVIPTVCRSFGWYSHFLESHVRYDPCVVGVLLAAINVFAPRVWSAVGRIAPVLAATGTFALLANFLERAHLGPLRSDWDILTLGFIFGSWVVFATSGGRISRACWLPGARYLADRAYAVYLLHPEALAIVGQIPQLPFALRLILTWSISLLLAELLYRIIERPFMQMREKINASRSRDVGDCARSQSRVQSS
jgi:peptidoglycan/LPS O-acetylase OafA/YrhL